MALPYSSHQKADIPMQPNSSNLCGKHAKRSVMDTNFTDHESVMRCTTPHKGGKSLLLETAFQELTGRSGKEVTLLLVKLELVEQFNKGATELMAWISFRVDLTPLIMSFSRGGGSSISSCIAREGRFSACWFFLNCDNNYRWESCQNSPNELTSTLQSHFI